ncbi:MAG: hypothetical protein QOF56_534, partial [Acidobacteriaceae bacterium]|nr:hypothetical protein [Acidobacteriaceae bacterium]
GSNLGEGASSGERREMAGARCHIRPRVTGYAEIIAVDRIAPLFPACRLIGSYGALS